MDEFVTPVQEGAIAMHENYTAYVAAGFNEHQALYLVGEALRAMIAAQNG